NNGALRTPYLTHRHHTVFHHADFQPFAYQANYSFISDSLLYECDQSFVIDRIKIGAEVGIQYPVHTFCAYSDPERIECVVLASSRTEAIREPEEFWFVYRVQHFNQRSLDDFVLQRCDAQRPFATVRLRNHPPP